MGLILDILFQRTGEPRNIRQQDAQGSSVGKGSCTQVWDLSLIPVNHIVGRIAYPCCSLTSTHALWHASSTHTHTHNK